jgi:hypothetical protein
MCYATDMTPDYSQFASGVAIFTALLIGVVFAGIITIYFDVRRWRAKGVPVNPARIAGTYFLVTIVGSWMLAFALYAFTFVLAYNLLLDSVVVLNAISIMAILIFRGMPVVGLIWYLFSYRPRLAMASRSPGSPAPSLPAWSRSVLVFVLPFFAIIVVMAIAALFPAY